MTGNKMYEVAEGAQIPAGWREDLDRALDFCAASATLAVSAAQLLDQARTDLAEAKAAAVRAEERAEITQRAVDTAETELRRILHAAGLVRTAEGIQPMLDGPASLEDLGAVHPAWCGPCAAGACTKHVPADL